MNEYNLSRKLSKRCSIPDESGDYSLARVEMNVLQSVFFDISLYNYIDVVVRRHQRLDLADYIRCKERGVKTGSESEESEYDEFVEKKVKPILVTQYGPYGKPLYRNSAVFTENFFISDVSFAFSMKFRKPRANDHLKKIRDKLFAEKLNEIMSHALQACKGEIKHA